MNQSRQGNLMSGPIMTRVRVISLEMIEIEMGDHGSKSP